MTTLTASLANSNSFHPVSRVSLDLPLTSSFHQNCSLHLVYRLAPTLFVDPYELAQRHYSYTFFSWGPSDLEKPVHAVESSETTVLVNVLLRERERLDVQVPLHARYGVPLPDGAANKGEGNYYIVEVARPNAFISCLADPTAPMHNQGELLPPKYLSQSQLREIGFESGTRFLDVPYLNPNDRADAVRIPIGHSSDLHFVQSGTALVILLSFFWVVAVAVRTSARLSSSTNAVGKRD